MSVPFKKKKSTYTDFESLLEPIYTNLYKYIYCIVRNNQITEDVVQETIYIALKSFENLRDKTKFKSWIFTIGKNEALKILKRYQREVYPSENIIELIAVTKDEPSKVILNKEEKKEIAFAINRLKEKYKDVIILRYYAELSLEEIAVILNKNYNTVRSLHKRARQILLQELKNTYWGEDI